MGPQLFMNAQKVDLRHDYILTECSHVHGNTRNKSKQSFLVAPSHSNQPVRLSARWRKGPRQKLDAVVKPEISAIVLNVMIAQKFVKFLRLSRIIHIDITPFVRLG